MTSLPKASVSFSLTREHWIEQTSPFFLILLFYISSFQIDRSNGLSYCAACWVALSFLVRLSAIFFEHPVDPVLFISSLSDTLLSIPETLAERRNPGLVWFIPLSEHVNGSLA